MLFIARSTREYNGCFRRASCTASNAALAPAEEAEDALLADDAAPLLLLLLLLLLLKVLGAVREGAAYGRIGIEDGGESQGAANARGGDCCISRCWVCRKVWC